MNFRPPWLDAGDVALGTPATDAFDRQIADAREASASSLWLMAGMVALAFVYDQSTKRRRS